MSTAPAAGAAANDQQMLEQLRAAHKKMKAEIGKIIIGQEEVLDELLMAIFCRGHALLVGVPGLAKTLMVSTLAQALDLSFKRIQFTPDLMPTDITGTEVIQDDPVTRQRMFKFLPGPIFANIVLADEINRTPPKTQAALLESMQERKASIGGTDYPMKNPFFVLATQNPIEQEGTYPLPEAQLDRFLFLIKVDYPTDDEEEQIMRQGHVRRAAARSRRCCTATTSCSLQQIVRRVPVADHVFQYAKRLTRMSPARHAGGGRLRQQVADLGRRSARQHEPDPGRQGPRGAARPASRLRRRRGRGRRADPAPSPDPELHRPERRDHASRTSSPAS